MSDFVAGFVPRNTLGDTLLQRAFGQAEAFAPAPVDTIGRRDRRRRESDAPAAPRHFSPARPGTNPAQGWDPFEAAEPVAPPHDFVDPVQAAREAGHAAGRAEALAEIEARQAEQAAVHTQQAALADQLAATLAAAAHIDRDRIAAQLHAAVLQLVTRTIGDTGIDAGLLTARVAAATDLLADSAEAAVLRLHPDDLALLEGALPASLAPLADPAIARGSFALESAATLVEDGPELWLEQLAQAIDRVPVPKPC